MTSLLAGTVAHGARGGRGVSTSHSRSCISGTPRYFPELPGSGSHNTPSINETTSFYLKCPHQNQNTTLRHDHVTYLSHLVPCGK